MNEHEPKVFGLIVAAGVGSRFGADVPKQYLSIGDKTVLEHSFLALCAIANGEANQNSAVCQAIDDCTVVVSKTDEFIKRSTALHQAHIVIGGMERWQSVKAGVLAIAKRANPKDLIAIHDAARPCLKPCDVLAVIDEVKAMDVDGDCAGAILASPVADTLKHVKAGQICHTVSRESLWQAQTPQVFFVDKLLKLFDFLDNLNEMSVTEAVTDEASGFEMMGLSVKVVKGSASNIKLTRADDLPLVRAILHEQVRL